MGHGLPSLVVSELLTTRSDNCLAVHIHGVTQLRDAQEVTISVDATAPFEVSVRLPLVPFFGKPSIIVS
jgi:hypothetical protein